MQFLLVITPLQLMLIAGFLIFFSLIVWYLDEQKKEKSKKEKLLEERITELENQLKKKEESN